MNWSRNTSPSWKPTSAHQLIRPSSRRSPAPTVIERIGNESSVRYGMVLILRSGPWPRLEGRDSLMVRDGARAPPHHEASIPKAGDGRPQIYHRKSRYWRDIVARRSRLRLRQHDVGRGHALADGRIADGVERPRRNRR